MDNSTKLHKRGGRGSAEKTKERRNKILKIIEEIGYWNLDKKQLSKMFNVSERQIYSDLKYLMKHTRVKDIHEVSFLLNNDFKKIEKEIRRILNDDKSPPNIKLGAINRLLEFTEKYTKFLEAYGIKEKIADKLEIVGNEDYDELLKLYQEKTKNSK